MLDIVDVKGLELVRYVDVVGGGKVEQIAILFLVVRYLQSCLGDRVAQVFTMLNGGGLLALQVTYGWGESTELVHLGNTILVTHLFAPAVCFDTMQHSLCS